jgi:hypothetical protein
MVLTNRVYTTQSFLEAITDKCYIIGPDVDNDIDFIHEILTAEGYENDTDNTLWDYPLCDIENIVHIDINVVLVEVGYFDENDNLIKEFRWFEVPEESIDAFRGNADED